MLALNGWKKHRRLGRTLLALLAFNKSHDGEPPSTLEAPQATQRKRWPDLVDLDQRIQNAANAYRKVMSDNHGIKESNIMGLLLPVGVLHTSLDTALLMDLSAFGEARGAVAHNSGTSVTTPPDPHGELKRVETLLGRLVDIDACFVDLQKEIALPLSPQVPPSNP